MNKIYLDTCIIIYFIEKHSIYAGKIEAMIKLKRCSKCLLRYLTNRHNSALISKA
jgi:hypothetical protein